MNYSTLLRSGLLRLLPLCLFLGGVRLAAQGGAPMLTDDADTPGDGHWEINVGFTTERGPGERVAAMPLVDLNYGIGERLQFNCEVAWLRLNDGAARHTGLGHSLVGAKWRFLDAREKAWSASVYPQMEFNHAGSQADERGLADAGTRFELPFQVMKEFGGFELDADLGHAWHRGGNEWFGGVAVGREIGHNAGVAVELHFDADTHFHDTVLTANAGLHVGLSGKFILLASLGRELPHGRESSATLTSYVGLQTCF